MSVYLILQCYGKVEEAITNGDYYGKTSVTETRFWVFGDLDKSTSVIITGPAVSPA